MMSEMSAGKKKGENLQAPRLQKRRNAREGQERERDIRAKP